MKREPAWRVFAGEYNDTTFEIKGKGEKAPSYVVTPLGAKINRLFTIGVLTDVEKISEDGELFRAHISDPTGVFTLYAGQYQPEATTVLSTMEVPTFVAVVGKARTYIPEEGTLYVSIRPEFVREVDATARDRWILETCMQTKERISAVTEAKKMQQPNAYDLRKLGYSKDLSEGIVTALKEYSTIDITKYITLLRESIQYLIPGQEKFPEIRKEKKLDKEPDRKKEKKTEKQKKGTKEEKPSNADDVEQQVLETIKEIEGNEGATWDAIVAKCEKAHLMRDAIEEALNMLMDKGLIFEPVLGVIKTT